MWLLPRCLQRRRNIGPGTTVRELTDLLAQLPYIPRKAGKATEQNDDKYEQREGEENE